MINTILRLLYCFRLEKDIVFYLNFYFFSRLFQSVVKYFDAFLNMIPLSFVLGFYVSYVASRWWQQFLAIPWPDKLFHSIACYVEGFDDDSRMLRRSLMRWMNLALILVLRSISSAVKQRFPTLDHVVEAGEVEAKFKIYNKLC